MDANGFGDLFANRHHRIQCRHWLLKHHGGIATAAGNHVLFRKLQPIFLSKPDAASDLGARIEQAQNRQRGDRFSRSRLADQRQRFARIDGEAQVIDSRMPPRIGGKCDGQMVNAEKRLHGLILEHCWKRCAVGSRVRCATGLRELIFIIANTASGASCHTPFAKPDCRYSRY